jgi:hypothetical protein
MNTYAYPDTMAHTTIEINDDYLEVFLPSIEDAKEWIKKNPRCRYNQEQNSLIYSTMDVQKLTSILKSGKR